MILGDTGGWNQFKVKLYILVSPELVYHKVKKNRHFLVQEQVAQVK